MTLLLITVLCSILYCESCWLDIKNNKTDFECMKNIFINMTILNLITALIFNSIYNFIFAIILLLYYKIIFKTRLIKLHPKKS